MVEPYEAPMPKGGTRKYGGQPTNGAWHEQDERYVYPYRGKTYRVARLVCEAFNGPAPEGMNCLHKDENSQNNRPTNLEWGTQKDNLNAPGFLAYCQSRTGEDNPHVKSKISKANAEEVKRFLTG